MGSALGTARLIENPVEEIPVEAGLLDRHKYTRQDSLIRAAATTKLLSARWLVAFDHCRGEDEPIRRCQDLPWEAFVDPADLQQHEISKNGSGGKYIVLAVSFGWLTASHPDPKGQQIGTLARVLSLMLESPSFRECADIAVYFDFCSLPQQPRNTPEDNRAFMTALRDVNLWFGHQLTWVLALTKLPEGWPDVKGYWERGWTFFEYMISSVVKDGDMHLDIGLMGGGDFHDIQKDCIALRHAPLAPHRFAERVQLLSFTNPILDIPFVERKYDATIQECLACAEELRFDSLGWGPEDMGDFPDWLPLAFNLEFLGLDYNHIGDEGSSRLAIALPGCFCLRDLRLAGNRIGDAGAMAVANALPVCPSMEKLVLASNRIGNVGAMFLANCLPACNKLEILELWDNQIGNEGAISLAGAVRGCPRIHDVMLAGNHRIGNEGASALAEALPSFLTPEAAAAKYRDPESLIAAAEAGGTALLSARWLVSRREGERLERRQDLPKEAFVDAREMRKRGVSKTGAEGQFVVLAVSYSWLTKENPDPKGQQVGTLARALRLMLASLHACADIAFFFDYGSLPQQPRETQEEKTAFKVGLRDLNIWYVHKLSWVLTLTKYPDGWDYVLPYMQRGWPHFEMLISGLIKDSNMCLDLGLGDDFHLEKFEDLMRQCVRQRCAPQSPAAFAEKLGRLHFTNGSDKSFVQGKYWQMALEVLAHVQELSFNDLGWGPKDMQDLAQVLPLAIRLQTLQLSGNRIGNDGAITLASALPSCPALKGLHVARSGIDAPGIAALEGAAAQQGSVAIWLDDSSKEGPALVGAGAQPGSSKQGPALDSAGAALEGAAARQGSIKARLDDSSGQSPDLDGAGAQPGSSNKRRAFNAEGAHPGCHCVLQ